MPVHMVVIFGVMLVAWFSLRGETQTTPWAGTLNKKIKRVLPRFGPIGRIVGFISFVASYARLGDPWAIFIALLPVAICVGPIGNWLTNTSAASPWTAVWLPSGLFLALGILRVLGPSQLMILAILAGIGSGLSHPDVISAFQKMSGATRIALLVFVSAGKWVLVDAAKVWMACWLGRKCRLRIRHNKVMSVRDVIYDLGIIYSAGVFVIGPASALVGTASRLAAEWWLGQFSSFSLWQHFIHWELGDVNSVWLIGTFVYFICWRLKGHPLFRASEKTAIA